MLFEPSGNFVVEYEADPALRVTVESTVDPLLNETEPVGAVPGDETVAVNFTECPDAEGFIDDTSVVAVVFFSTTCATAFEVLPVELASPA